MIYISFNYYILVGIALLFYYVLPVNKRWLILLAGNVCFYYFFYKTGWLIFLITIVLSFIFSIAIEKAEGQIRKILLFVGLSGATVPWMVIKNGNFVFQDILKQEGVNWIVPLGISFYTLQIISYMVDVYKKKITAEKNIAKFGLFISYFPQLIQGPIPRYEKLGKQLTEGHIFDEDCVTSGFYKIIWGFFLKLVIADKAAVIVNGVFDSYPAYSGFYILIAGILYSIQLYADFMGCTFIAMGVSMLFGIRLEDNFRQPYFSKSVKEFWQR